MVIKALHADIYTANTGTINVTEQPFVNEFIYLEDWT